MNLKERFTHGLYRLVSVVVFSICMHAVHAQFVFPITPWSVGCNDFWGVCVQPWHLGEDVVALPGDGVKACADGRVVHVDEHTRYGYVIIVEHQTIFGEYVSSLYGHLRSNVAVAVGDNVFAGEVIGYIGDESENGGWSPHLHFGIKKGPYNSYTYACSGVTEWSYGGYTSCESQKSTWYDPSNFISFLQAYNLYNPQPHYYLGNPKDNGGGPFVHDWWSSVISTYYLTVQDFEHGILVLNPLIGQVYPIVGGFYQVWIGAGDPARYGFPLEAERYTTDSSGRVNWAEQKFDGGIVMHYDGSGIIITQNGVQIALIPGDGKNLIISAYALSDSQIYVTSNNIGQTATRVYLNGSYAGELVNFEWTISGLLPQTAYQVYLAAFDASGNELSRTETVTVTTKATPPPTVTLVDFQYWVRLNDLELLLPSLSGASYAIITLDGSTYTATPATSYFFYGLPAGSHTVWVSLYNGRGELIGQSPSKQIITGGRLIVTSNGPLIIDRDGNYQVVFTVYNGFSSPLYNWQYNIIASSTDWLIPVSDSFADPGVVPAGSSIQISVPFRTQVQPVRLVEATLVIYAYVKCDTSGQTLVTVRGEHNMAVKGYPDWAVSLPDSLGPFSTDLLTTALVTVTNQGLASAPSSQLTLYLDSGTSSLIASLLVPQLLVGETWQQAIPLGVFTQAGDYRLIAVVAPEEVIQPSDNTATVTFSVVAPLKPDYQLISLTASPAEPWTGDTLKVAAVVGYSGASPSPECEVGLMLDGVWQNQTLSGLTSGQTLNLNFSLPTGGARSYDLLVQADVDQTVAEADEQNNWQALTVNVISPLPTLPPPQLVFLGTEDYTIDLGPRIRYKLSISNWADYPDRLFSNSYGVTCGLNTKASRTWVKIWSVSAGGAKTYIYGFCALGQASNLTGIWFGGAPDKPPPSRIQITLEDQVDGSVSSSNLVTLPFYDLAVSNLSLLEVKPKSLRYSVTVKNLGSLPVDLSKVAIQGFVSNDTIFNNGDDKAAGGRILATAGQLAAGESHTVTQLASWSKAVNFKYYRYLMVQGDYGNAYVEVDETNNFAYQPIR